MDLTTLSSELPRAITEEEISNYEADGAAVLRQVLPMDWIDVMRHFVPEPERLYSWWSYRSRDWKKSNKGRRLDHVWITPALEGTPTAMMVDLEARDREKPSDHAPVIVDFDLIP